MRKRMTALLLAVLLLGVVGTASADWRTEEITLTYASWADAELEQAMLDRFMEKYPNITVVKDSSINWPWNEALAAAASAGTLPDVFYVFNIPTSVHNEWLLELDELWDKDPDCALVYSDVADTAVYHGQRYAAPSFMFAQGVFINKTLFEEYNVDLPGYDWTIDDMIEIAREISDPYNHVYAIGGGGFHEHWPAVMNPEYGWNTWDGEKFNFTDPSWVDAYNTNLEFQRLKIIEQMTPEEKLEVFGDENAWPLKEGRVAMAIDYTWNLGGLPREMKEAGTGELDFYPYPAGPHGNKTYVVPDYIGVSSVTEHPEAAFELMKWMSFGREGWLTRLELLEELGQGVSGFPVANYPEVWEVIQEQLPLPGLAYVIDTLDNTYSDVFKWLPGIDEFHNWAHNDRIWERLETGEANAADLAVEMEQRATQIVQDALKLLK